MYSSASELLRDIQSLSTIVYLHTEGTPYDVGLIQCGGGSLIFWAAQSAKNISRSFTDVNNKLSEGWASVKDFTNQIDNLIKEELDSLIQYMSQFSVDTIDAEAAATQATENAISSAQSILNQLQSSSNSEPPSLGE